MMAGRATGQRSPRWAFMARMTIPCENGLLYLARLRIVQTPWFGIYLHDIYEPDSDPDRHDHPWTFVSVVLRGGYVEKLHPEASNEAFVYKTHRRFSMHRMGRNSAHQIVQCSHERGGATLKTLILVGRRAPDGWGFWTDEGYVPWQRYKGIEVAR